VSPEADVSQSESTTTQRSFGRIRYCLINEKVAIRER
jgi:hypothetical protein